MEAPSLWPNRGGDVSATRSRLLPRGDADTRLRLGDRSVKGDQLPCVGPADGEGSPSSRTNSLTSAIFRPMRVLVAHTPLMTPLALSEYSLLSNRTKRSFRPASSNAIATSCSHISISPEEPSEDTVALARIRRPRRSNS